MFAVADFAVFFKVLLLIAVALVILVSVDYMPRLSRFHGEYHALVLLAALGMMLMVSAIDLISIFVAVELTSICFYALVGILKDKKSLEAALKYVLIGGIASAVLLYGMALTFGFTGKTQLLEIAQVIQNLLGEGSILSSPGLVLGIVLLIAGFGFKIAAVPFHMWAPDVYEGAPTPITLYLSIGSKVAGLAVIMRLFISSFHTPEALSLDWGLIFAVLSVITMTTGNILAVQQTNIKRMLAYSGIAHSGYILVGLAATGFLPIGDLTGPNSILFYVAGFVVSDLAAFIAIIAITNKTRSDSIKSFNGMGKISPLLASGLTLSMLSLSGIPPAVGFIAKFYIFSAAASSGLLWLVIVAVLNSVISAYYYLRVVKITWFDKPTIEGPISTSLALRSALLISSLGILLLGIVPGLIMRFL
jgi:NADH-quinone oxidoreductase subunit N